MRKSIPEKAVAQILLKTRRRCCLCYYLDGDKTRKKVQIAHIDHNHENNTPENLVPLCLDHHDEYDSKTSQSKGISKHELIVYKKKLIEEAKAIFSVENQITMPDFSANMFYSYGVLFSEISRIIYRHDPIEINFGSNDDEYDPEAHDIIARLELSPSKKKLKQICKDVFIEWFGRDEANEFNNFEGLANDIWKAWQTFKQIRQIPENE